MRIVIATAVYYPQINGVAMFSHNLAVGLSGRGHEVMVIAPSQNGKNHAEMIDGVKTVYLRSVDSKVYPDQIHDVPKQKKVFGAKVPRLFYRNGFRVSVFPQIEVKRALDDFHPDIVHVQISDPIGLSVVSYARKHNVPVVTTEHNQPEVLTESLKMPRPIKKGANYVLTAYFRNRQSKSDFVTMPTERAIRSLLGNGEKIKVPIAAVSNGVDLSNFKPGKVKAGLYEKYGISKDLQVVLYVGRVDPEKKVGLVVEAFIKARSKFPKMQLVVVGDGVDRTNLEHKYGDDENIKILGKVLGDDLHEIYKIGSVFATASEIETQGIVLIEAAASGLPLIAVDKGAVSEICINGENGVLCEPRNVSQIADAIVKIMSDPKLQKEYSEKSIEIAHEHDFESTLDKFINIYNHLLRENNTATGESD
ncbi:glycosyltransferase [Candidatus Saccharibacteria bacterium]|nr:glycosyltransferase [Candidatus Saccharibacteria bacterium]